MLAYERREQIRRYIAARGRASVAELSESLQVSLSTIRWDLARMQRAGLLRREHGGASAVHYGEAVPEPPFPDRVNEQVEEKRRIGRAAAELVNEGETVFIGGGTTTPETARMLRNKRNLTVITNAWRIAQLLIDDLGITLVIIGGVVRRDELSMVGPIAEQSLRDLRADKVIMGIRAIHPRFGLTNDGLMETLIDRSIIRCANELIVVADHTKFGCTSPSFVAPVTAISTLVTDIDAPAQVVAELRHGGVRVIQV